jgi:hypothetical protein
LNPLKIDTDRKTDIVFVVKDFLFSHEPSAWRFDVKEQLNGRPQVVDFTDDATGSPHEIAKSRVSMYVNEVGHSSDLVENVEALNKTDRSITYFINIDKPLAKGDTVELLVNYKVRLMPLNENAKNPSLSSNADSIAKSCRSRTNKCGFAEAMGKITY